MVFKYLFFLNSRGGNRAVALGGSTGNLANQQSRSERDLTKVTKVRVRTTTKDDNNTTYIKQRTKMKTTTMIVNDPAADAKLVHQQKQQQVLPIASMDVVRAPLNWQLAESTAQALQQASDNLVQLYKRISLDYDLEEATRTEFLRRLQNTAGLAQQTLKPVNPGGSPFNTSASNTMASNVSPQHKR